MNRQEVIDALQEKLKVLSETIWDRQHSLVQINAWADQFSEAGDWVDDERIHALYLLTHFTYFGQKEVRTLLVGTSIFD